MILNKKMRKKKLQYTF